MVVTMPTEPLHPSLEVLLEPTRPSLPAGAEPFDAAWERAVEQTPPLRKQHDDPPASNTADPVEPGSGPSGTGRPDERFSSSLQACEPQQPADQAHHTSRQQPSTEAAAAQGHSSSPLEPVGSGRAGSPSKAESASSADTTSLVALFARGHSPASVVPLETENGKLGVGRTKVPSAASVVLKGRSPAHIQTSTSLDGSASATQTATNTEPSTSQDTLSSSSATAFQKPAQAKPTISSQTAQSLVDTTPSSIKTTLRQPQLLPSQPDSNLPADALSNAGSKLQDKGLHSFEHMTSADRLTVDSLGDNSSELDLSRLGYVGPHAAGARSHPTKASTELLSPAQQKFPASEAKPGAPSASQNFAQVGAGPVLTQNHPHPTATQAPAAQPQQPHNWLSSSDAFADIAEQLQSSIASSVYSSQRFLTIRLYPPELGKVFIKFQEKDNQITALLQLSKPETLLVVQKLLPQLMRNLQDLGVQIRRFDLSLAPEPESQTSNEYPQHTQQDTASDRHSQAGFGDFSPGVSSLTLHPSTAYFDEPSSRSPLWYPPGSTALNILM